MYVLIFKVVITGHKTVTNVTWDIWKCSTRFDYIETKLTYVKYAKNHLKRCAAYTPDVDSIHNSNDINIQTRIKPRSHGFNHVGMHDVHNWEFTKREFRIYDYYTSKNQKTKGYRNNHTDLENSQLRFRNDYIRTHNHGSNNQTEDISSHFIINHALGSMRQSSDIMNQDII